ncbi:MAG TPA: D-glycerate dehydrogenase [Bacillota bacterium]|nr:D-glycerate dehydrogenase [Bacillota bacterium]
MSKPKIYITRKLPEKYLKPYENDFEFKMWQEANIPVPRETLLQAVSEADGILSMLSEKIDEQLIEQANRLKIVSNLAVGYDNVDLLAMQKNNIVVTNTPDVLTETTADLTFALLLATARRLIEASEFIKKDKWEHWSPFLLAGADVNHQTIGIVGMGRIGQAVARRAKGFNMNILYHNRSRDQQAEKEVGATYTSFNELIGTADFIVSLVPLTQETKHLFDEKVFSKMKSSAIFINVSRGQVVDETALYEALKNNVIQAAGLDVFQHEPIRSDHPLMQLSNVVCLPHIGSASVQTREKMIELCLQNLHSYFYGSGPLTEVRF